MASVSGVKRLTTDDISGSLPKIPRTENSVFENNGTLQIFPAEIIIKFLEFLPPSDLASISLLNRYFQQLSSDEDLWKLLCKKGFPEQPFSDPAIDPKGHYQICANMRNGRYAVEEFSFEAEDAEKEKMQVRDRIDLVRQNPHPCSFQNNCFLKPWQNAKWNGIYLARAQERSGLNNIEIWELDGKDPRQILDVGWLIGYNWQGHQLVTVSLNVEEMITEMPVFSLQGVAQTVQIWNPDEKGDL